jgi:hypothetical protein
MIDLGFCQLKDDLIEHHDYEAVSQNLWKYISSWYSFDYVISRYLSYDGNTDKTYLDLYP